MTTKNKAQNPRDVQVRERLSGAALLGRRMPAPMPAAVDARPQAGEGRWMTYESASLYIGGQRVPIRALSLAYMGVPVEDEDA